MPRFPDLKNRIFRQEEFDFGEWLMEIGFECIERIETEHFGMYRYENEGKGGYIYARVYENYTYLDRSQLLFKNEEQLLKAKKDEQQERPVDWLLTIYTPQNRSFAIQLFAHLFQD